MLVPHFQGTAHRTEGLKSVLVIHDATKVLFALEDDQRDGLGRMGNQQGFIALPALVLSDDAEHRPLGLAGLDVWTHDAEPNAKKRRSWGRIPADRWLNCIFEAGRYAREDVRPVHVIDSEAESYKLFFTITERGEGFVVRFRKQRNVALQEADDAFVNVADAADKLDGIFEVDVPLSARKATQ